MSLFFNLIAGTTLTRTITHTATNAFRTLSFNIYEGGRDAAGRDAVLKHIDRVNPDILTLTEVGNIAVIQPLLEARGFGYFYGTGGIHELFFASKYPINNANEFVMSGRNPLYCEVNINGDLVGVVSHHNASWCMSGCNTDPSQLPAEPMAHDRMVQLYMTLKLLNDKKAAKPALKGFIIQGDWNDDILNTQVQTYSANVSGGMALPAYLSYPLDNGQFPIKPLEYYNGTMQLNLSTDLAGSTHTIWENDPNPGFNFPMRMDYIAYSDSINLVAGEILNSEVDDNTGMSKAGSPLNFADSRDASDHKAVMADFTIQ